MKPHMNPQGNGKWAHDWGDKVKTNFKRIFSKGERQLAKKQIKDLLNQTFLQENEGQNYP